MDNNSTKRRHRTHQKVENTKTDNTAKTQEYLDYIDDIIEVANTESALDDFALYLESQQDDVKKALYELNKESEKVSHTLYMGNIKDIQKRILELIEEYQKIYLPNKSLNEVQNEFSRNIRLKKIADCKVDKDMQVTIHGVALTEDYQKIGDFEYTIENKHQLYIKTDYMYPLEFSIYSNNQLIDAIKLPNQGYYEYYFDLLDLESADFSIHYAKKGIY